MKKALSFCLALALVLAALPLGLFGISVMAAKSGDYTYTVSNGKATITDVSTSLSGELVIPDTLDGYPVTAIGYQAFYRCDKLTAVTIPNGVTEIGHQAFYYCRALTSISLPDSLTTIGKMAFYYCRNLASIDLPIGVTAVGERAFAYCDKLTAIQAAADSTVYSSQDGVLFSKDKTTLLAYPEGKTATTYAIPRGVVSLGKEAFYRSAFLQTLTIPESVTTIGAAAFADCTALLQVDLPGSVFTIGAEAFRGCVALANINALAGNRNFSSQDGVLFNKDGTALLQYPLGRGDAVYTVPSGVSAIGSAAFYGCNALTGVVLTDGVKNIGEKAFGSCLSLAEVTIPASVTEIGYEAFAACAALETVTLSTRLQVIGDAAFYGCNALTKVQYLGSKTERGGLAIGEENDPLTGAAWSYEVCINTVEHTYTDKWDADCDLCGSVREAQAHVPGDINDDGAVNNRDGMILTRYLNEWSVAVVPPALDVNGDGSVNNRDVMVLTRYLNEWDVTIH